MNYLKIAITGHTNGIGKAIYDALSERKHDVTGFSLTNGYNISSPEDRSKIISESMDCSVFINNAFDYSKFPTEQDTDSQCLLAEEVFDAWMGEEKYIINIGSRINDFAGFESTYKEIYAKQKKRLDQFYLTHSNEKPYIITIRPGTTDTRVVSKEKKEKLRPEDIAKVLMFILDNKNTFIIRTVTLGN